MVITGSGTPTLDHPELSSCAIVHEAHLLGVHGLCFWLDALNVGLPEGLSGLGSSRAQEPDNHLPISSSLASCSRLSFLVVSRPSFRFVQLYQTLLSQGCLGTVQEPGEGCRSLPNGVCGSSWSWLCPCFLGNQSSRKWTRKHHNPGSEFLGAVGDKGRMALHVATPSGASLVILGQVRYVSSGLPRKGAWEVTLHGT